MVLLRLALWSDERRKRPYLVAFIDELVSTSNKLQTVDMVELGGNLVSEEPAGTTGRNSPCLDILGIAPDQVAKSTLVGDLLGTSYYADLINRTDLGAQTAVNAENLAVDDGSEDKEVKNLAARLPDGCVTILLLAFLVESVDLGDLTGFMVTSDESDLVGVPFAILV